LPRSKLLDNADLSKKGRISTTPLDNGEEPDEGVPPASVTPMTDWMEFPPLDGEAVLAAGFSR